MRFVPSLELVLEQRGDIGGTAVVLGRVEGVGPVAGDPEPPQMRVSGPGPPGEHRDPAFPDRDPLFAGFLRGAGLGVGFGVHRLPDLGDHRSRAVQPEGRHPGVLDPLRHIRLLLRLRVRRFQMFGVQRCGDEAARPPEPRRGLGLPAGVDAVLEHRALRVGQALGLTRGDQRLIPLIRPASNS